jgi:hypothetical protein
MSDYGDLISASFGQANPALPAVVGNVDEDPERAQRAMDLAQATGVPSTAIFGDLDEFERQHKAVMASDIVANNPHLADFVQSNPMVPKLANDDYGNLDNVSQKVQGLSFLPSSVNSWLQSNTIQQGLIRGFGTEPIGEQLVPPSETLGPNNRFAEATTRAAAMVPELALRSINALIYGGTYGVAGPEYGEQLGQLANDPGLQATLEGLGPPGAVVEGLTAALGRLRPALPFIRNGREPPPTILPDYDRFRADLNASDLDDLKDTTTAAQASLLRERNPDLFRDFIAQHTDAQIGVSGDAVAALYGDKVPEVDDGLLGWAPGIGDQLALARETGDDIHIPLADWLAKVDPQVMDALKDDIRVRPGGITANEAKASAEADAAYVPTETNRTPGPNEPWENVIAYNKAAQEAEDANLKRMVLGEPQISEPVRWTPPKPAISSPLGDAVPAARAAAALEPMLSIGDRKLELQRMAQDPNSRFGAAQGFHDFNMVDEKGNTIGAINISEQEGGKKLYVDNITGVNGLGPRDFGPALMRDVLRQIKQEFPNAESIAGHRVSGAREAAGKEMLMPEASVKLDALDDPQSMGTFGRILQGGQWEQYSPSIRAYIKPDAARTPQQRQLVNAVYDELDRIAPKKTAIQAADTIKADAGGVEGQRAGESIRVGGAYLRYKDAFPTILFALDADDALGTARHEAIHHLRQYGFFEPEEWSTLEAQALAGNWFKKYRIDDRYPTAGPSLKLEESVAEAYMDWAKRQDALGDRAAETAQVPSPLDAIFQRMKDFFDRLRERFAAILGKDPTWEDIFKKVDTGEVGGREGTAPLDTRAFDEKLARGPLTSKNFPNGVKRYPGEPDIYSNGKQTLRSPEGYNDLWSLKNNETAIVEDLSEPDARRLLAEGGFEHLNPKDVPPLKGVEGPAVYNPGPPREQDSPTYYKNDPDYERKTRRPTDAKSIADKYAPRSLEPKLSVSEDPEGGSRVFERANALGMTVDQFRRYDELLAKRHAEDVEATTRRAMEDRGREQTREWRDNRKAVRQEVSADIRQRPDVAADLFFGSGELYGKKVPLGSVKLDASALTDAQKAALPRNYYGEHGLHPDDVANLFGYGSGGAMLDHLTAYNRAKLTAGGMSAKDFLSRVTDVETDRQMQLRYGNLQDNILDAVKEQVSGETQQNILAEETLKLGLDAGKPTLDKATVLAQLRDQFAKMPLGSVSSDAYLRAAGKAGRQAEFGLLNNDPEAAYRAKQQQWYATVIANEAAKLEREIDKFNALAKRFSRREVPSVDPAYTNFIHDILVRVGRPVRRSVQDLASEIAAGEYKDLQSFVEGKQGFYLREVAVDERLFDPSFRKAFDDLTVDEFRGVDTSIKSLVANGRDERKITKAGTEADLAGIRDQMINQLRQFQERAYDAKGGRWMGPIPPRIAKVLRTYGVAHIQMENLFNRWDHDNPQGVFQQYVMRDLVDAANTESAMEKRYAARLRDIDDKADLKALVDNPLFKVPGTQQLMQLNRGNLRAILLNVGNSSNLDKLARGYGLKKEEVLGWVHRYATEDDWNWAQSMGDIFAELKGEADVMYRQLSGVAPESIRLDPIATPFGQKPGWYYPLIAHPEFEGPTKRMMGPDALKQQGFIRATTANGYTKSRTNVAYPLALDLDTMPSRMKQMIHDIAMRPSVINASKIFYDKDIRSAVFTRFGAEWRDMLTPYLVDVANSANYMPKEQRQFAAASEFIRQNLISTLVGLNPSTVIKHGPTALAQSLHEVGTVPFLRAMKSLFSINDRTGETNWQFAMQTSEELQRRHQNYVETLGGATDLLQPTSGYASLRNTIQRLSASPVAMSDLLSAVPTWLAQYEKTLADGATHGDSVYAADRAVRRAHGSVAITNRSAIMRGGALSQWFSSVYGFFNHIMNRQYELLWKSGEALDLAKQGDYRAAMQRAPELTSMLFTYVLAPALVEEAVTPLASQDGDSWGKKAAKGIAFTLGASWVGVRDVANALLNGRDPSVGLISTAAKTITDFGRDLHKQAPFGREHAGKVVRDGSTLLGALSGVVPAQVGRTAEFGLGVSQGTERPRGPWGWLTGARYGTLKGHPPTFSDWQRHHLGGH